MVEIEQLDDPHAAVVFFDGECRFCNGMVRFLLDRDQRGRLRFAALQSRAGQSVLSQLGMPFDQLGTMVLVQRGRAYVRSSAALRVLAALPGVWKLTAALLLVPRFIRDAAYRWFAARRYSLFGKSDRCTPPAPEQRRRFLD